MNIFWTPISIVITIIIFFVLWSKQFYNTKWAKNGRIVFITVIVMVFLSWFDAKVIYGRDMHRTFFITTFTKHISKLLEENKIEKAKETLAKFNAEYHTRDVEETGELVKRLIKESQ